MAKILGGVAITGFISPSDSTDTYATHDEVYGRGGYRAVMDQTERLAIPPARRKIGMLVRQLSDNTLWSLREGITDSDWEIVKLSEEGKIEIDIPYANLSNLVENGYFIKDIIGWNIDHAGTLTREESVTSKSGYTGRFYGDGGDDWGKFSCKFSTIDTKVRLSYRGKATVVGSGVYSVIIRTDDEDKTLLYNLGTTLSSTESTNDVVIPIISGKQNYVIEVSCSGASSTGNATVELTDLCIEPYFNIDGVTSQITQIAQDIANLSSTKADKSTTYTKTDIDSLLQSTLDKFVIGEDQSHVLNGIITSFTTHNIYRANSLKVFFNGSRLRKGEDYTEKPNRTGIDLLIETPEEDDSIIFDYIKE